MALEAIGALYRALLDREDPADREARSDALYGAWLCGMCLGAVGMSLHRSATLGGTFDLPHAETHTAVLPRPAYNAPAIPSVIERLRGTLGADPRERASNSPARSRERALRGPECPRTASTSPPSAPSPTPTGTPPARARRGARPYRAPTPARDRRTADKPGGKAVSQASTTAQVPALRGRDLGRGGERAHGRRHRPAPARGDGRFVKHLHAFVKGRAHPRGVAEGHRVPHRRGQMRNEWRRRYILLSDILGVSMLVDAINHRRPSGATENTILGHSTCRRRRVMPRAPTSASTAKASR